MRFLRFILLQVIVFTGVMSGYAQTSSIIDNNALHSNQFLISEDFSRITASAGEYAITSVPEYSSEELVLAVGDNASTNEGEEVTIDVLDNDIVILATIDPATIDIDMTLAGRQDSYEISEGSFKVDAGMVIYTPAPDYHGSFSISYTVEDDGGSVSSETPISITVNDKPHISGQTPTPLAATEDDDFSISISNLTISDDDDGSFTLTILPGTNYDFSGTIITPDPNYNGPLTVNVKVNDGAIDSDPFGVSVSVAPANDRPVIDGQTPTPISATENIDFTIPVSNLSITDIDGDVTFTVHVLSGSNYTTDGTTIIPLTNYNGPLTINVTVSDGAEDSDPFGVAVSVEGVNNPPVITGQTPATIAATEDTDFTILVSNLTITDADGDVSFTRTILSGTNYTTDGTTITPTLNYNGALTVNVKVNDGIDDSAPFGVAVNVAAFNDQPVITSQTPATISATENQTFSIALSNLTIFDPDNSVFTLTVLPGTNYTPSGNNVMPATNYNGPLTVNVKVNDGAKDSAPFGVAVNVGGVNNPPVITGQTPATIAATEDTNFTITVSNLIIDDADGDVTFTRTILSGTNYTTDGATITPVLNYNGPLTVNIKVNDGTDDSAPFGVAVNVAAFNDPPVITGQTPATIVATENQSFVISLSNLVIVDPDNATFILTILPGTNYSFSAGTVTPAPNYNGPLTVNVRVSDGSKDSAPFGIVVNVAAVNTAPVITGQTPATIAATEGQNLTIALSNLLISDPDNSSFTLTVLTGTNYTFSGNTITPASNYSGPLTVNVKVNDGTADSAPFGVAVNVSPVNDAPIITGQTPASIPAAEDVTFSISLSNLIISDPDNSIFTLTVLPGTNYTFSGTNITPASNYTGPLTVNVKVRDGAADSAPFGVAVSVAPVNDVPVITGQSSLSILEDQPIKILLSHLIVSDPDNTYPNDFTLSVRLFPGANYSATGDNVVTPNENFNGLLIVRVSVDDGQSESVYYNLKIQVNSVNNSPVITGQNPNPLVTTEDVAFITLAFTHLLVTDPDDTYPSGFTLTVLPGTNYTFSGKKITPAANFNGDLLVSVKVNDGVNDSAPHDIKIRVNPVNDAPVITDSPALSTNVDTPITIQLSNLNVTDIDNTYPTGFTLSVLAGANYTSVDNKVIPDAGFPGTLLVKVRVNDGVSNSNIYELTIKINTRPVLTPLTFTIDEDAVVSFQGEDFSESFTDTEEINKIKITDLPKHGVLRFSNNLVKEKDEIPFASITELAYQPDLNFSGKDTLFWNAHDGLAYSKDSTYISFVINPVNDAPVLTIESDTLKYEIGKEFVPLTQAFGIKDVDDDSLIIAEVQFRENYKAGVDILSFKSVANISGSFDGQTGVLKLSGKASLADYVNAVRSIEYRYASSQKPPDTEILKSVYISVSEGKAFSTTNKFIKLIYTFEDLNIVNGFTPNGNLANETWAVLYEEDESRLNDLNESKIRVYNKEGLLVYESTGFNVLWDGKYKGQLVPAGSYYYTIEAVDSKLRSLKKVYKGIVNVLY